VIFKRKNGSCPSSSYLAANFPDASTDIPTDTESQVHFLKSPNLVQKGYVTNQANSPLFRALHIKKLPKKLISGL